MEGADKTGDSETLPLCIRQDHKWLCPRGDSFSQSQILELRWRLDECQVHLRDMEGRGKKLKKELRMHVNHSLLSMSQTPQRRREGGEWRGWKGKGRSQVPGTR